VKIKKKLVLFENTPISFMVYQHISLFKIVKMLGKYAKKQTHPVVSRLYPPTEAGTCVAEEIKLL
jgi:hypothetical protein